MSFIISFIHHIILFMVQDQHSLQSQIRHWENCWLEIISPELMFVFLISLTSISQFHSKGQLLFNVNGNNSFLLYPRYLAQGLSIEIQCSKAVPINQIIITFTHNQCMWCFHNHCCKAKCTLFNAS